MSMQSTQNIRLINNAIKSNLQKQDWEKLARNLAISLIYGGSVRLRKLAAKALGTELSKNGDHLGAIGAFEHAKMLSPKDRTIRAMEIRQFSLLLDMHQFEATETDLIILRACIDIGFPEIPPNRKGSEDHRRGQDPEIDLRRRITELLPNAPPKNRIECDIQVPTHL